MSTMVIMVRNKRSLYTVLTNWIAIGFRRVEGGIFRLGMLLEDIQEQMDGSKGSLSSLLTSYESAQSFCEVTEF